MRRVGLLAVLVLVLGAWAPTAGAGPLNGAEKICQTQGGTWHPSGFPTFPQPTCSDLELTVWNDEMKSGLGSNQLTAANCVCQAAGFGGAQPFGRAFVKEVRLGFLAVKWSCVGNS